MLSPITQGLLQSARHSKNNGDDKMAGVAYIIIGLFLTPYLIGIPVVVYGGYLLFKE